LAAVPVISIIDDDASVRMSITRLVRALGYPAHAFASADEFLKSPHLDDTSCVITDVQMPGIGGIELQARLRAQGCAIPIIFITAFPDEKTKTRALDAGAIGFLSKPFDSSKLIACVDIALKMRRG
jgi:FixJ family two-component response regulator